MFYFVVLANKSNKYMKFLGKCDEIHSCKYFQTCYSVTIISISSKCVVMLISLPTIM